MRHGKRSGHKPNRAKVEQRKRWRAAHPEGRKVYAKGRRKKRLAKKQQKSKRRKRRSKMTTTLHTFKPIGKDLEQRREEFSFLRRRVLEMMVGLLTAGNDFDFFILTGHEPKEDSEGYCRLYGKIADLDEEFRRKFGA